MIIQKTAYFEKWQKKLNDTRARVRIALRIDKMGDDYFGDVKPVGEGVFEAKIDYGPGYRLYYCLEGNIVIILLCGGTKSTQKRDIDKAKELKKCLYLKKIVS